MTEPRTTLCQLTLADTPNAVAWARRHTVDLLRRWQVPPDLIQTVRLVVSELATNAIRHPGAAQPETLTSAELATVRMFTLGLQLVGQRVIVQVADRDPQPPLLKVVGTEAESGRGVFLVDLMSQRWGHYHPPTGGKVVWAEVGPSRPQAEPARPSAAARPRAAALKNGHITDPLLIGRALVGLREL